MSEDTATKSGARAATACVVLAAIRDIAQGAQAGPESACPITPENGEKLRAALMKIQRTAMNAIITLGGDA